MAVFVGLTNGLTKFQNNLFVTKPLLETSGKKVLTCFLRSETDHLEYSIDKGLTPFLILITFVYVHIYL